MLDLVVKCPSTGSIYPKFVTQKSAKPAYISMTFKKKEEEEEDYFFAKYKSSMIELF